MHQARSVEQGKLILIVDDESIVRETVAINLRREGLEVVFAADGLEAIETARTTKPDVVVLDIMLPGIDGFQVCRTIREESTVPIILLSARGEEIDRVVGLELGADDFLVKPFAMRELVARVRAMLRRAKMATIPADPISANGGPVRRPGLHPAGALALHQGRDTGKIESGDVAILVIEQNIGVATEMSDPVAIMVNGRINRIIASATLAGDRDLQQRLLGVGRHGHDETDGVAEPPPEVAGTPRQDPPRLARNSATGLICPYFCVRRPITSSTGSSTSE